MPMARTPSSIRAMYASFALCDVAAECFGLRFVDEREEEEREERRVRGEFKRVGTPAAGSDGMGRAPCGGGGFGGGVPFGRAAFGSA